MKRAALVLAGQLFAGAAVCRRGGAYAAPLAALIPVRKLCVTRFYVPSMPNNCLFPVRDIS